MVTSITVHDRHPLPQLLQGQGQHVYAHRACASLKALSPGKAAKPGNVIAYPPTEAGLPALSTNVGNATGWEGPYMNGHVPNDPWGRPYVYRSPGDGGKDYDLATYGADGKPGGTGEDADIVHSK